MDIPTCLVFLEKKEKDVRHQKVNSYKLMEIFFNLFFNMISATAFEIAANTVNILLLYRRTFHD